jgi:RNA polymerase sigma factor (sigma-70 family)
MNLANSWFRRRKAERTATDRVRAFPESRERWQPEEVLAVRAAVSALPRRQRTALVLRYFRDLTVEQAAHEMGCRPGTVKALTSQAIAGLRRAGLDGAGLDASAFDVALGSGRAMTNEEAPDVA